MSHGSTFSQMRRREAELDEYEQLLFSEDFSHEADEDVPAEVDAALAEETVEEAQPAEEQSDAE